MDRKQEFFQQKQEPFDQNIEFHLFRTEFQKLCQKIVALKKKTPDAYIQNKLTGLEFIKSRCDKAILEYNTNYFKYPQNEENLQRISKIFALRFGIILFELTINKQIMEDLLIHRDLSSAIFSRLPQITGAITGVVACTLSGPFLGVVGFVVGTAALKNITGMRTYLPDSGKILIDLMVSLVAKKGIHSGDELMNKSDGAKIITIQWIKTDNDLPSNIKEKTLIFRNHHDHVEVYIGQQQWMDCNSFLLEPEIASLKTHQNQKDIEPTVLIVLGKISMNTEYHFLNESLTKHESLSQASVGVS